MKKKFKLLALALALTVTGQAAAASEGMCGDCNLNGVLVNGEFVVEVVECSCPWLAGLSVPGINYGQGTCIAFGGNVSSGPGSSLNFGDNSVITIGASAQAGIGPAGCPTSDGVGLYGPGMVHEGDGCLDADSALTRRAGEAVETIHGMAVISNGKAHLFGSDSYVARNGELVASGPGGPEGEVTCKCGPGSTIVCE